MNSNDKNSEMFMVNFLKKGWIFDLKIGLSKQSIIEIFSMPDHSDVLKSGYELWLYQDLQMTFKNEILLAYKFEPSPKHSYLEYFSSEFFKEHLLDQDNAINFLNTNLIKWIPYPDFTFEDQYTILTEGNVLLYYVTNLLGRISVHEYYKIKE